MNTTAVIKLTCIHLKIFHICFQPVKQWQHQLRSISLQIMGNDNRQISISRIVTGPGRSHSSSPDTLKIGRIDACGTNNIITCSIENLLY